MTTTEIILDSERRVREVVDNSKSDSRKIIARYTAAFAVNFTDWIGKTIPWVRHESARFALIDNLRCEATQDHIGMLERFAINSGSMPDRVDYNYIYAEIEKIRKLFAEPATAGLSGVALCTVLENTSLIFIPDLAERAKGLGCTEFTYTDAHGEADIEHSKALLKATESEETMGYQRAGYFISEATELAIALIKRIYT